MIIEENLIFNLKGIIVHEKNLKNLIIQKELKKQSDRISQEYKNELFIQNRKESDNTYMNLPKKEEDMLCW